MFVNLRPKADALDERQAIQPRRGIEGTAYLTLAASGLLSAVLWLLVFALPYSLLKYYPYAGMDLERIQIVGRALNPVLLVCLATQGALYWLGWQSVRQIRGPLAWLIVAGGALLGGSTLLFMYPVGSTDIFDYIVHGRMVGLYGVNPFVQLATQFPFDPFTRYAGWPTAPSAYGPLWELLAGGVARIPGDGVVANVVAFKLLAAAFLSLSGLALALILRRAAPERALSAVFLLTWNPIVLYETVGNAHNDIVMVFCVLVAVLAILYRRFTVAVLALLAGALIKYIPILMLPAAGLIALRELRTAPRRARFVVLTALAALAFIVVIYAPFWTGPSVFSLQRRASMFASSLPAILLHLMAPRLGLPESQLLLSRLAAVVTFAYALFEGVRAWRDRSWLSLARSAYNLSILYVLVTALWLWPWYAIWPLALAALFPPGGRLLLAEAALFGISVRPFAFAQLIIERPNALESWVQLRMGPAVLAFPYTAALYLFLRRVAGALGRARSGTEDADAPVRQIESGANL